MQGREKTAHAAKGKWRGILGAMGLPAQYLTGQHGPCPMCGGKDRFRFDNREGSGSFICSQCGSGDGFELAKRYTNRDFAAVAADVDRLVGNIGADPASRKREWTDEERVARLRETYAKTQPITPASPAHAYFEARRIADAEYPKALRFARALSDGEGGVRPCIVAVVGVYGNKAATLHRTYLREDCGAKAEMASPRKMMPGPIPEGACVQLSDWTPGPIGIAEGIETALAASALFEMPVWAALNAGMLAKWAPPPDATEVAVFGDHDANFVGQAAAYQLAARLRRDRPVTVHIPPREGEDWADVLFYQRTPHPTSQPPAAKRG